MAVSARWVVVTRLPIMMFLEFFVLGSTTPIFSLYLKQNLGFSSIAIGWVLGRVSSFGNRLTIRELVYR